MNGAPVPTPTFVYDALPMRVVFGRGSLERISSELDHLGLGRVLVLCTPDQRDTAERVAGLIGTRAAGIFAEARMHVPVETVAAAAQEAGRLDADGYLAVGGGSTVGLGKALALQFGAPVIAVPTTYAGSEMTPIWGLTENAQKRTGRDRAVLPRSVVYDPDLTLTLPAAVSVTSALNALAHAVEALYAPDGSPVIAAMAEQGVRDLAAALPGIVADPHDHAARAAALQGAWLCGACLGATTMGLHHKLCHALGGTLDLPHAETHAIVLPHVAAFNLPAAPSAAAALGRALGTDEPARALVDLADSVGAPRRLSQLGVTAADLPQIVDAVLANPYSNPRPVGREELEQLLAGAL
jgi:maleylacetate reductase